MSAAKAAADLEWPGTFLRRCVVPPPPRSAWYAEPAKIADNFYFLATKVHNAWTLEDSDGIILFEALFNLSNSSDTGPRSTAALSWSRLPAVGA